ncbi:hypothetical protein JYT71_00465 [Acidimicrobiaceae bacterium AH-315-P05]|nr:hypothetical protein [Acidimicrobiaceae bacterium AH-315-P05]
MSDGARDTGPPFVAPGAGRWTLDLSHFDGGTTPIVMSAMTQGVEGAFAESFANQGIPARTMSMRWANGFAYSRLLPLVGAERPSTKAPPALAVKVLTRLHPEFRRRTKAAVQSLNEPPYRDAVDDYYEQGEAALIETNETFQKLDVGTLDDEALSRYAADLVEHLHWSYRKHFELHSADLGAIAQLAYRCKQWGIAAAEVVGALSGASPHTSEPALLLEQIREELNANSNIGAQPPTSIDDLRSISPVIAELVDAYMTRQGWVIYSRYDLDGVTLAETSDVFLATVVSGSVRQRTVDHAKVIRELRERVPMAEQPDFDYYVEEARFVMGMRDAQGPLTVEWPNGLLRRAMLEVGRRAVERGQLTERDHVFCYEGAELVAAALALGPRDGDGSTEIRSASEMAEAAELRSLQKLRTAPRTLGPVEPPPPLDALPKPLADLTAMVTGVIEDLGMGPPTEAQDARAIGAGVGIGTESFVGVARVAATPEEALNSLEPGEILVTLTTTPAYNLVLTMVGGLVTAEGGPVSHAAVLARELGIPAVIGARDVMQFINSGDTLEIDPVAGTVQIVD